MGTLLKTCLDKYIPSNYRRSIICGISTRASNGHSIYVYMQSAKTLGMLNQAPAHSRNSPEDNTRMHQISNMLTADGMPYVKAVATRGTESVLRGFELVSPHEASFQWLVSDTTEVKQILSCGREIHRQTSHPSVFWFT